MRSVTLSVVIMISNLDTRILFFITILINLRSNWADRISSSITRIDLVESSPTSLLIKWTHSQETPQYFTIHYNHPTQSPPQSINVTTHSLSLIDLIPDRKYSVSITTIHSNGTSKRSKEFHFMTQSLPSKLTPIKTTSHIASGWMYLLNSDIHLDKSSHLSIIIHQEGRQGAIICHQLSRYSQMRDKLTHWIPQHCLDNRSLVEMRISSNPLGIYLKVKSKSLYRLNIEIKSGDSFYHEVKRIETWMVDNSSLHCEMECLHNYHPNRKQDLKYSGIYTKTKSGRVCQRWDTDEPHKHSELAFREPHNYCRQPKDDTWKEPWCYTVDPDKKWRWEVCGIPRCDTFHSGCNLDLSVQEKIISIKSQTSPFPDQLDIFIFIFYKIHPKPIPNCQIVFSHENKSHTALTRISEKFDSCTEYKKEHKFSLNEDSVSEMVREMESGVFDLTGIVLDSESNSRLSYTHRIILIEKKPQSVQTEIIEKIEEGKPKGIYAVIITPTILLLIVVGLLVSWKMKYSPFTRAEQNSTGTVITRTASQVSAKVLRKASKPDDLINTVKVSMSLEALVGPMTEGQYHTEFTQLKESTQQMILEQSLTNEEASQPHNLHKNEYKNILPYDSTRVPLYSLHDDSDYINATDYINASYVEGENSKSRTYIAAQGPLSCTLNDFWRMIWQEEVRVIVMLTNFVENGKIKCVQYFPQSLNDTIQFSCCEEHLQTPNLTVQCTSIEIKKGFTLRHLHCTRTDEQENEYDTIQSRSLCHLHLSSWSDHSVPELHIFADLLANTTSLYQIHPHTPILVHCSAGVGRTGTFIACHRLHQRVTTATSTPAQHAHQTVGAVTDLVLQLRSYRPHMVQTMQQFKFIHYFVLELSRMQEDEEIYFNDISK